MNYKNKFPVLVSRLLILILIFTSVTNAQFNTLVFKKSFFLTHKFNGAIQALGDQNKDGYDDFLIYDCSVQKSYIFFGGNPVDTIPKFSISERYPPVALVDLNNDGIRDFVFYYYRDRKIKIYFGGTQIDTVPDLIFNPPLGVSENFVQAWVLKNFIGDGKTKLVFEDPNLPYSQKQFGSFYFYDIGSTIDTIPHHTIFGDSVNSVRLMGIYSVGDINGDGKTDFAIIGYQGEFNYFISFYLGNSEWNLKPAVTYKQSEHSFDVTQMFITKDLNKDRRDDIIIRDYGFYPYYYKNAVLKGSFPIDTIPAFGLNTQNEAIYTDVVSLGDVNGDRFNDFLATTPYLITNDLKLWLGGRKIHEVADKTWYGTDPEGFCEIYGAVGDVNGDRLDDIAIGSIHGGSLDCDHGMIYIFGGDSTVKADTITSIKNYNVIPPSGFKLNNPYPNPFNPNITITWQSSIRGKVRIKLFDILGREVALIMDEEKQPGNNKIEFDASKYKLTSGVYLLQVEAYDNGKLLFRDNKKLNYLK